MWYRYMVCWTFFFNSFLLFLHSGVGGVGSVGSVGVGGVVFSNILLQRFHSNIMQHSSWHFVTTS